MVSGAGDAEGKGALKGKKALELIYESQRHADRKVGLSLSLCLSLSVSVSLSLCLAFSLSRFLAFSLSLSLCICIQFHVLFLLSSSPFFAHPIY